MARGGQSRSVTPFQQLPVVTITLPVYNEEQRLRRKLDELLQLDYPADRRHILVISDASTDATDQIAREYACQGVELLRLPRRSGKSAAENAAGHSLKGEIVVNSDATVMLPKNALMALVRAFEDPSVGVASGRDVSVGTSESEQTSGERSYVGYEMWIRRLETRLGSIVGASGCFYGIRAAIYNREFPEMLSRDFASALMARERGYRAVAVDDAICYVPRASSLQAEFRRKIRTMSRGIETLWFKRHLLNPWRHGLFAFCLLSHKLSRWLVYLTLPLGALGIVLLSFTSPAAVVILALCLVSLGVGSLTLFLPNAPKLPGVLRLVGFAVASNLAGVIAWADVLRREHVAIWEPTRRDG
jgi:cellulose synthase/poly-beta-1,6-N-acetylglucosamine synthase-like glycosyltransferase